MEAIKLKPQILTKEFSSVPHHQRTPKVKDKGEPKERGTTGTNDCKCERKKKDISKLCPVFFYIWLLFNFYYLIEGCFKYYVVLKFWFFTGNRRRSHIA